MKVRVYAGRWVFELEILNDWDGYGPDGERPLFEFGRHWSRSFKMLGFGIRDRWTAVTLTRSRR